MRFDGVRHQERALAILHRGLESGRAHHAYLFAGPEGVGKERVARALAARLLCLGTIGSDGEACGACDSCRLMSTGNHPDFHLIDRALHKFHPEPRVRRLSGRELVIDVVRRFLIDHASVRPALGKKRIFVVREAERMTDQAQNALLKTLEEPPGESCLILLSASAGQLLPTIRSRCQLVPFGSLPTAFVREVLSREMQLGANAAATLAALSGGRPGAAMAWHKCGLLTALDAVAQLVSRPADMAWCDRYAAEMVGIAAELALRTRAAARGDANAADVVEADDADEEAAAEGAGEGDEGESTGKGKGSKKKVPAPELREAMSLVLMLLSAIHRDALAIAAGAADLCVLPAQSEITAQLAAQLDLGQIEARIEAAVQAEAMIDANVAPLLALERLAAVSAMA